MTFAIVLIGWIFSLCLHEFAHALVAYTGGDHTVKDKGYLTFNPLKYTHPVYSLLLPMLFLLMGGIGLPGGAVYIEKWRLRNRFWEAAVSLAGPLANALLALTLGLVLQFTDLGDSEYGPGLAFLGRLQIIALVLNLLPIPPLDGYQVLASFLPAAIRETTDRIAGYGIWILLLLMWNVPTFSDLFWGTSSFLADWLGISASLASRGLREFMFWRF